MIKNMKKYGYIAFVLCVLAGCASQKQISYLQDVPDDYRQKITQDYGLRIHPDDLLSIMVNSKDPELAQMFNLPMVSYQIANSNTGYAGGQNRVLGYLVDKEGNIDFPQLGVIKVQGMTRAELTKYIKNQLIEKGLVKDPIVTIQFLNFKVSVLGEVNRPGTFEITSDRITLLDALSLAGDLTIYGQRENIKVVREENGERVVVSLDLRNKDLLSSPYYYLQQNDVVYVEPNATKARQSTVNGNNVRSTSFWISLASLLTSIAVLIAK